VGKLFGLGMRFSKSCNKWLKLVSDHPFLAVEVPFWVVVRRRRMLTVRARVCDENVISISLHPSATVTLVTTWRSTSFDREESKNPRTY
jgi:hypothetical protein